MRKLHLQNTFSEDGKKWRELLSRAAIKPDKTLEEVFGIFDGDKLEATAARYRNIIKCVAVVEACRGTNLINELISGMYNEVFAAGYSACYVYTKEDTRKAFEYFGFREIEHVGGILYFMEHAAGGFRNYLNELRGKRVKAGEVGAAIVMNANPFTKGHLHLVTQAATENDEVHLFILSEDASAFSTSVRTALVRRGTAHLKNIVMHPTSDYLVSAATFPAYFLKEDDDITEVQARLDARIFKHHIAPALGVTVRYVGKEPFSNATDIYNMALEREFAGCPELRVLDRLCIDGEVVSATRVRELLAEGKIKEAGKLVPPTTYDYFISADGQMAIEALRLSQKQ